jgi:hypothetical protein
MASLNSSRIPFTIHLPSELVVELEAMSRATGKSVDDIVMEACAACVESFGWEQEYREWCRANPPTPENGSEHNESDTQPQPIRQEIPG